MIFKYLSLPGLALVLSGGIYFSSFVLAPSTGASGTADSDTNDGQVQVVRDGDVQYLGTAANDTTTTNPNSEVDDDSTDNVDTFSTIAAAFDIDELPEGFFTDAGDLLSEIINIAFIIAVILAFAYLIWGGFDWITSGGDQGRIQNARQKLVNAVVGLIVVAASYAILTLTLNLLGYESLNDVFLQTAAEIDN